MNITPGATLFGLHLLRLLSIKAFSCVWEAREVETGRTVVLKLVPTARYPGEVGVLERLRGTPGIVELLWHEDWGIEVMLDARPVRVSAIVLKLCEGGDLWEWRNSRVCSMEDAIVHRLFFEIATALQSCHRLGISHLDLKPENILLSSDSHALLSSFSQSVPFPRALPPSPHPSPFSPPESSIDSPFDPKAADVFSLGILLFVLHTKQLPFQSAQALHFLSISPAKYWAKLPSRTACALPQAAKNLFERMVCPDPGERLTIEAVLGHAWLGAKPKLILT